MDEIYETESMRERQITFNRIRNEANPQMVNSISNCKYLSRILNLGEINIPNIVVTYNNKIIELEKEFTKAGIDFYDRKKCESRFILEYQLQSLVLLSTCSLSKYVSTLSIPKEHVENFLKAKLGTKNNIFDPIIKKFRQCNKYSPNSLVTPEQKDKANSYITKVKNYNQRLYDFTIQKNFVDAILYYRLQAKRNRVKDFDERIEKIDSELIKLGYDSILEDVNQKIKKQDEEAKNSTNPLVNLFITP